MSGVGVGQGTTPARSLGYQPALDGVRGLAALAVILYHGNIPYTSGGFFGVDVFFTLSGFLITSLLLSELWTTGAISLRRFYVRRGLRLLPAYVAVVLASIAVVLVYPIGGTARGVVSSAVYVSNWVVGLDIGGLGLLAHTWSLSVEEQFYLLWPVGLLLLGRRLRSGRRLFWVIAGVAALMFAQAAVRLIAGGSFALVWNGTDARAFELLAGAAAAVVVHQRRAAGLPVLPVSRAVSTGIGAAGLVGALALVALWSGEQQAAVLVGWPLVTLCSLALILCSVDGTSAVARVLSVRPLVAVGKVSYGAYLWHFPVFVLIDDALGLTEPGPILLGLGVTAAVTVLSYVAVERPFLRLKSRFEAPRPAAEPVPGTKDHAGLTAPS